MTSYEVPSEQLRWECATAQFPFECTVDLVPLQEFVGQTRAIRAVEFGLSVNQLGYNIFVTGLTGTGKTSVIKAYLQKMVENRTIEGNHATSDWCYVYNFVDPDRPLALQLPKGQGRALQTSMLELLKQLRSEIVRAFSNDTYEVEKKRVIEEGQTRSQQQFQQVEQDALKEGFTIQASATGVAVIPMVNGRPATEEQFMALDPLVRTAIETRRREVMKKVAEAIEQTQDLQKQAVDQLRQLDQRVGEFAVTRTFDSLITSYAEFPTVVSYVESVKAFTLSNLEIFREDAQPGADPQLPGDGRPVIEKDPYLGFKVNVVVDNSATVGPPIVIETNPTYANMFGRIDRRAVMGAYLTDHTMLKPGAVAMANGGYLVLNARKVLTYPAVWEGLKRVVQNSELRLEDPAELSGYTVPQALKPGPIPVDLKVIMIGDSSIYRTLSMYDEDFWEIFKVKAEFGSEVDKKQENIDAYASFICGCCVSNGLAHFDRSGVARVIEYGARLVADQQKLSSRFGQIKDLLVEADYWARKSGSDMVGDAHVRRAIEERVYRSNLIQERMDEMIADGTIMVDTEGAVEGQVNGLAVYELGDVSFGKPSRITARTYMGRRGVINIERESALSGNTHDKGILILGGYLASRFAQDRPLSVSATVCFEQSYDGVDGDSASSTELYAILSSLSGLPIRQEIAVTGSVNQRGDVQPIGGVNEKIEGYFEVCRLKGLTGTQGVMIPRTNVRNLMLKEDVVDAVKDGRFHIYAVSSIEEGVEILTGVPAGERSVDGSYPEGTVNYLVEKRLEAFAQGLRQFQTEVAVG